MNTPAPIPTPVAPAIPWYKSPVLQGLVAIVISQAIAKAQAKWGLNLSAYGIDASGATQWTMNLISVAAVAYATHSHVTSPPAIVTLTKARADTINLQRGITT
jgi:hypothetical protein